MPATLATVDAILKEVYEPSIREQMNDEVIALRRIERSSEGVTSEVGGKYVVFPIHISRNGGIGARLEGENLPVAGNQGFAQARVRLRYQYGRIQLNGQVIELADSNFQAFASALDQEVSGVKDDLAKDINRQIYGDGSGVISLVSNVATLASFTVASVQGLSEGMSISLGTVAAGVITPIAATSGAVITSIDPTTKTITTSGATPATATAIGQVVFRANTNTDNSGQLVAGDANQKEWTGLNKIVATTGVCYNVDPAVVSTWKGNVDSNSGTNRALSEGLILTNVDKVRTRGTKTTVMFMNLGVRRAYFNLLVQQRQFTNTKEFDGGFTGLGFTSDNGEVPMVVDTDAPSNTIYGLNEKEIKLYREGDWSFMNRDGSQWSRVANKDAYEATLYQYSELGTHRRHSHFKIADVTEG